MEFIKKIKIEKINLWIYFSILHLLNFFMKTLKQFLNKITSMIKLIDSVQIIILYN